MNSVIQSPVEVSPRKYIVMDLQQAFGDAGPNPSSCAYFHVLNESGHTPQCSSDVSRGVGNFTRLWGAVMRRPASRRDSECSARAARCYALCPDRIKAHELLRCLYHKNKVPISYTTLHDVWESMYYCIMVTTLFGQV